METKNILAVFLGVAILIGMMTLIFKKGSKKQLPKVRKELMFKKFITSF